MTDLPALLMLAEKATAGSRELDYAIAEWAHSRLLASYRRLDGDNGWYSDDPPISGANKIAPADAYTFSIDCALGLVEQMNPGWFWRAGHVPSFHWHNGANYDNWCHLSRTNASNCDRDDEATGWANSVPLAIIVALLRSLIQEHKDGQP